MRVLVYENSKDDLELLCNDLSNTQLDLHVDSTNDLNLAFMFYDQYHYDAVLFNIDSIENRTLMNLILFDKKIKKIIALSDNFDCFKISTCEFCKNPNYHLLVKPVYPNDLIFLIFGHSQREAYCLSPKLKQLKLIDKEILNFNLCIEQNMFINKNSYLQRENMLPMLLARLSYFNINYEVDNTQNIRIL